MSEQLISIPFETSKKMNQTTGDKAQIPALYTFLYPSLFL